jgi:hypothetical protein
MYWFIEFSAANACAPYFGLSDNMKGCSKRLLDVRQRLHGVIASFHDKFPEGRLAFLLGTLLRLAT